MTRRTVGPQRGFFTMTVVVIIGLLTLLTVRLLSTATQDSTRIAGQAQANIEAFYAAEVAMSEALAWLQTSSPAFSEGVSAVYTSTQAGVSDVTLSVASGGNQIDRTYLSEFWFSEGEGGAIKVTARAHNDAVTAVVTQWLTRESIVAALALDTPLALGGCFKVINGTPEVNAIRNDGTRPDGSNTLKIPLGCGTDAEEFGCSNSSSYDKLNRSSGNTCTEPIYADLTVDIDLWASTFNISQEEMRALADASASDDIHWLTSGSSQLLADYGSATSPIILILEDCPSLPSNTELIGVVYTLGSGCKLQGSGSQRIKGALIISGSLDENSFDQWNANDVIEAAYLEGTDSDPLFSEGNKTAFDAFAFGSNVKVVPGTWSDRDIF